MKKQQQEKTDLKQQLFMCFILSENASSQTYFNHTPPPKKNPTATTTPLNSKQSVAAPVLRYGVPEQEDRAVLKCPLEKLWEHRLFCTYEADEKRPGLYHTSLRQEHVHHNNYVPKLQLSRQKATNSDEA